MTQQTKWIAASAAVIGALALASSARAQAVTGDPTLDNIAPTAVYDGWNSGLTTITSVPGVGLNVNALLGGGGSGYFGIPSGELQVLNSSDNQVSLTFTVNQANWTSTAWVGAPFLISDAAETGTAYGGYVGQFGYFDTTSGGMTATFDGNTVTETAPLDAAQVAAIQTGTDVVTGFNLEFYPAFGINAPSNVTFDSLVFSSSVPEPTTFGLIASGVAGLLAFRRRNK